MMFYTYNFLICWFQPNHWDALTVEGKLRDVRIYFFVLEKPIESDVVA